MTTKKEIGDLGEKIARRYLMHRGYWILAKNWRHGKDELDIIARTYKELVFTEVKTRCYEEANMERFLPPSHAVNPHKQAHTRAAAMAYMQKNPSRLAPRMDVIEIYLEKRTDGKRPRVLQIRHIKGAY